VRLIAIAATAAFVSGATGAATPREAAR